MMTSVKYLLFIALVVLSCTGKQSAGFINHDKWKLPYNYDAGFLRNKPKEVTIQYYGNMSDTSLQPSSSSIISEETYKFDDKGDLVSSYVKLGDMRSEISFRYNDSGFHYNFCSKFGEEEKCSGEYVIQSTRVSNNSFRLVRFQNGKEESIDTIIFKSENESFRKRTSQGVSSDLTIWHKDDRKIKEERKKGQEFTTTTFHRNARNFLDSITNSNNNEKLVFINNEHGDPLFQYEIKGKDTTGIERMKYEYDKKGNWIRQLKYNSLPPMGNSGNFPNYTLNIREIKY